MRVLEIEGRADFDKVESGFDSVGEAAESMARKVDSASDKVDSSASRLDRVGESADNLDSKAAQATGSLGALSSGFELMGAEGSKAAQVMGMAALATDTLAGVGEGLNLITQLSVVQKARDIVMTRAQALAARGAAVATRAQAVAMRILNVAMRANPIGLVITAVLILVGLMVALYKRNERFRSIVQAVGRAGRAALGWVVDKARELVGWIGSKIPGGFSTVKRAAELYIRLATLPMRTLIRVVSSAVDWIKDKAPAAFRALRDTASGIADKLTAPFRALRDLIQSVVDWIGRIDFPDVPDAIKKLPGVPGRVVAGTGGGVSITTVIQGVVSDQTARQVERANVNALRRVGIVAR